MANLCRVRAFWGGPTVVGGGVSTFYFDEAASGFIPALGTFFTSVLGRTPTGTSVTLPNSGDLIDIATGALSGTWTDTAHVGALSSAGTGYASGVGARIVWRTSGIRNSRRVVGSTYIVPLLGAGYDADGTLTGAYWTTLDAAAGALFTAKGSVMKVYSRPVGGPNGQANQVIAPACLDKVSWLRSRRT